MELTVEWTGRGSRYSELQKVSGKSIRIGRGYDNDIVLTDPHVGIHHALIEETDDGELILQDLDSVNGTYTKGHQPVSTGHKFSSGEEFVLGKTKLRIFRLDHALPEAIRLTWVEKLAHTCGIPFVAGLAFSIALLMSLFFQYIADVNEFHVGREFVTALGALLLVSIWPVCWSIFARVRKHEARFFSHWTATLVFIILVTLVQKFHNWMAFHTGINFVLQMVSVLLYFLFALLLIWFNYYLSVFQAARQRWLYSILFTGILSGIAYVAFSFDDERFARRPQYHAALYPPFASFYTARSVDDYLHEAESIFEDASRLVENE